jgi:hypothetical protein
LAGAHPCNSTLVQSFSADLDSMFGLGGPVGELEQTVEEKCARPSLRQGASTY